MTIEQAKSYAEKEGFRFAHDYQAFLSPEFWKCLGKAMGWTPQKGTGKSYHDQYNIGGYPSMYDWQIKWHRFIDHLASGGTPVSFFKQLN